jgi:signal transduction histidine kinase
MYEKAEQIGAKFTVDSTPRRGTEIIVVLPAKTGSASASG